MTVSVIAYSHPTADDRAVHDLLWTKAAEAAARSGREPADMGAPGPTDNTDREPDPPAWWDEQRGIERMEDAYERELDRRWE